MQATRISMVMPPQVRPVGQCWENCQELRTEDRIHIDCAVDPLAAGAGLELRFEVVSNGLPHEGNGNLNVQIVQWPALVLESSTPRAAVVEFKVQ